MSQLALEVTPPFSPFVDTAISTDVRETAAFFFPDLARMKWLVFSNTRAARALENELTLQAVSDPRTEWMCKLAELYAGALEAGIDVEPSTYLHASQFLALLPPNSPEPDILVEEDGEIAFDWDLGRSRVISISVGRDGTLIYAALAGIRRMHGVTMLEDDAIPSEVLDAFAAVVAR